MRGPASVVERQIVAWAPAVPDLSTGFRIAEVADLVPGPIRVEVALLGRSAELIASRTISLEVTGREAITASVTRTCAGVSCPGRADAPEQSECLGGRCVTADCALGRLDSCETPSLPMSELLDRSVEATCQMLRNCLGSALDVVFRGEDCAGRLERYVTDVIGPSLAASLANGHVIYHGHRAFGCLNALGTECRSFGIAKEHLECIEAIEGTRALGESCGTDFDCSGVGTFCDVQDSCPGVCVSRRAVGEPCLDAAQCELGDACLDGACRGVALDGEPCEPGNDQCQFDSICLDLDGTAPICHLTADIFSAQLGDPCGDADDVLCDSGLACVAAGTESRCEAVVGSGASCAVSLPSLCPVDEYCDSGGRCAALPGDGEACANVGGGLACGVGHVCDGGSETCVGLRRVGESCSIDSQCAIGFCVEGRCPPGCS